MKTNGKRKRANEKRMKNNVVWPVDADDDDDDTGDGNGNGYAGQSVSDSV